MLVLDSSPVETKVLTQLCSHSKCQDSVWRAEILDSRYFSSTKQNKEEMDDDEDYLDDCEQVDEIEIDETNQVTSVPVKKTKKKSKTKKMMTQLKEVSLVNGNQHVVSV